jgi:hypothetical protein
MRMILENRLNAEDVRQHEARYEGASIGHLSNKELVLCLE